MLDYCKMFCMEVIKMKKSDIFLILGLVVVIVLGCFLMKGEKYVPDYKLPLKLEGEPGLHQLTYAEFQKKVDNDDGFVFIIERASCSYCVEFMPKAEKFAKDFGVPLYYVDTDTFSDEDWTNFEKSITFFKRVGDGWGTPTTLVLAGEEEVAAVEGATEATELKELYNEYFDMGE